MQADIIVCAIVAKFAMFWSTGPGTVVGPAAVETAYPCAPAYWWLAGTVLGVWGGEGIDSPGS